MAILKAAFNGHPRTVTLINAYSEGGHLLSSDVGVNPDLQSSNGLIDKTTHHGIQLENPQ